MASSDSSKVDEPHRAQAPSALLIDPLARFQKGPALDVACGRGRNALYLASQGFDVVGIDRDPEAIAFCKAEASRLGVALTLQEVDLEQPHPLPDGPYALVTCFYYLDRTLLPDLKKAVRPGGHLVYETFLIDQHTQFGKPGRREFCWEHNELLRHFLDFQILFYFEGLKEERWIVQLVAERSK
ncbi:MAG: class I SAM-dependent methyltransferase [Nitrospirae bacterium]|nr:class I SAM-dependent methyltransferase [Candidatus Manganitrophaceae bacterium]